MLILGINDGHDASACLVQDGKLLLAVAEERLQRIKNMSSFPHCAIKHIFDVAGFQYKDVDHVAVASEIILPTDLWNTPVTFKNEDYYRLQEAYHYPQLFENRSVALTEIFPGYKVVGDIIYPLQHIPFAFPSEMGDEALKGLTDMRRKFIAAFLQVAEDKVSFYNHHRCHALYAYYTNPFKPERMAVVTSDGGGDGNYETISVVDKGQEQLVSKSRTNLIGKIYASVTLLLGMNPHRHPYKVMGLAPYATEHHKKGPREIFLKALQVDGLRFTKAPEMKDTFFYFKEQLKTFRFDGIAGGVQDFAEIRLTEWFNNISQATGTSHFSFSGGTANNVKANMILAEKDHVDSLYIPPGPSDESLSIGAVYCAMYDKAGAKEAFKQVIHPRNAYWGGKITEDSHKQFKAHPYIQDNYEKRERCPLSEVAEVLAGGEVVAFCVGPMEFGSRALGHRSFLADPSNMDAMRKLNDLIKKRDFWMPFTPSILEEKYDDYVINPKQIASQYMTICFHSTALARQHLKAAIHPYDYTVRPQKVTKGTCPIYHQLLSEFHKITGIGALLNTSLNVHEKPIVYQPTDLLQELLLDHHVPLNYIFVEDTFYRHKHPG